MAARLKLPDGMWKKFLFLRPAGHYCGVGDPQPVHSEQVVRSAINVTTQPPASAHTAPARTPAPATAPASTGAKAAGRVTRPVKSARASTGSRAEGAENAVQEVVEGDVSAESTTLASGNSAAAAAAAPVKGKGTTKVRPAFGSEKKEKAKASMPPEEGTSRDAPQERRVARPGAADTTSVPQEPPVHANVVSARQRPGTGGVTLASPGRQPTSKLPPLPLGISEMSLPARREVTTPPPAEDGGGYLDAHYACPPPGTSSISTLGAPTLEPRPMSPPPPPSSNGDIGGGDTLSAGCDSAFSPPAAPEPHRPFSNRCRPVSPNGCSGASKCGQLRAPPPVPSFSDVYPALHQASSGNAFRAAARCSLFGSGGDGGGNPVVSGGDTAGADGVASDFGCDDGGSGGATGPGGLPLGGSDFWDRGGQSEAASAHDGGNDDGSGDGGGRGDGKLYFAGFVRAERARSGDSPSESPAATAHGEASGTTPTPTGEERPTGESAAARSRPSARAAEGETRVSRSTRNKAGEESPHGGYSAACSTPAAPIVVDRPGTNHETSNCRERGRPSTLPRGRESEESRQARDRNRRGDEAAAKGQDRGRKQRLSPTTRDMSKGHRKEGSRIEGGSISCSRSIDSVGRDSGGGGGAGQGRNDRPPSQRRRRSPDGDRDRDRDGDRDRERDGERETDRNRDRGDNWRDGGRRDHGDRCDVSFYGPSSGSAANSARHLLPTKTRQGDSRDRDRHRRSRSRDSGHRSRMDRSRDRSRDRSSPPRRHRPENRDGRRVSRSRSRSRGGGRSLRAGGDRTARGDSRSRSRTTSLSSWGRDRDRDQDGDRDRQHALQSSSSSQSQRPSDKARVSRSRSHSRGSGNRRRSHRGRSRSRSTSSGESGRGRRSSLLPRNDSSEGLKTPSPGSPPMSPGASLKPAADDGVNTGGGGSIDGDGTAHKTDPWKPAEEDETIPVSPDSGGRRSRRRERDPTLEPQSREGNTSPSSRSGAMKRKRCRAANGGSVLPDAARKRARGRYEDINIGAEASADNLDSNRSTGDKDTGDTSGGDTSTGDARSGEAGARGPDMDRPRLIASMPLDEMSSLPDRRLRNVASKCQQTPPEAEKPESRGPRQTPSAKHARSGGTGAGAGTEARGQRAISSGESAGAEERSRGSVARTKTRGIVPRESGDAKAATSRRQRSGERREGGAASATGETNGDHAKAPVQKDESDWRASGNEKEIKPAVRGEGLPVREDDNYMKGPPSAPSSPAAGATVEITTPSRHSSADKSQGRNPSASVAVLEVQLAGGSAPRHGDERARFLDADDVGGSVARRSPKNKRKRAGVRTHAPQREYQDGCGNDLLLYEENTEACGGEEWWSPSASTSSEENHLADAAEFASCDGVPGRKGNGIPNDNETGEGDGEDNAHGRGGPGDCDGVEEPGAVDGEAGDSAAAPMAGLVEDQRGAKRARTDVHAGLQGDSQLSGKAVSSGDRRGYLGTGLSGSGAEKETTRGLGGLTGDGEGYATQDGAVADDETHGLFCATAALAPAAPTSEAGASSPEL